MKFVKLKRIHRGTHISYYEVSYETEKGRPKTYELISRDPDITRFRDLDTERVDAVVMILHNAEGDRILLNHEFRMAPGTWVYNFPAGLIDAGETAEEAAKRELLEETGLQLLKITEIWKESFSAVGYSNEKSCAVLGTAGGEFSQSSSDMEEINAAWYTREEVRELLKTELFSARTQAYCAMWCKITE